MSEQQYFKSGTFCDSKGNVGTFRIEFSLPDPETVPDKNDRIDLINSLGSNILRVLNTANIQYCNEKHNRFGWNQR